MASTPVPGENPKLDAETTVPLVVGMSIGFVTVSTVIVLLRLITRYFVVRAPGSDDITIAIAQILSIAVSITTVIQAKFGLGRHVWIVSEDDNVRQLKSFFAGMVIYNLAQIVTKTSFLLQYRRIFQDELTRKTCFILLILLGIWGVVQEVLVGFACFPVSVFFPHQKDICITSLVVWYLTSIMNIVTDFIVFMVPMPAIRSLQLRRKQKLLVISVFGLGFFTCAISILRVFTLRSASNSSDPTWDNVPPAYWSIVELNCGILCASLPPLRPLIRHLLPGLSDPVTRHQNARYGNNSKGTSDLLPFRRASKYNTAAAYGLRDVESVGSEEGLKGIEESSHDGDGSAAGWYSEGGMANELAGGKGNRIRTEIKGGMQDASTDSAGHRRGENGQRGGNDSSSGSSMGAGERRIVVTREIGFEEDGDGRTSRSRGRS